MKPSEPKLPRHFRRFVRGNFRPKVGNDVISGISVGQVGLVAPLKFGDSSSNGSRDLRLTASLLRTIMTTTTTRTTTTQADGPYDNRAKHRLVVVRTK